MSKREQVNAIVNRHIARVMTELTEMGAPEDLSDHVKSRLQWLRSDLYKFNSTNDNKGVNNVRETGMDQTA